MAAVETVVAVTAAAAAIKTIGGQLETVAAVVSETGATTVGLLV